MPKLDKSTLVVMQPTWEIAVKIGSCWFDKVLSEAQAADFDTLPLVGPDANTAKFKAALDAYPTCFLTGVGHGNETTYTGERYAVLLRSGGDLSAMANKPWYALSCKVGKRLGADVVKAGCPAFIGYAEDFVFLAERNDPCGGRPAKGFMVSSNAVVSTLIDGATFEEAYISSQRHWDSAIEAATNEEEAKWLLWDKTNQVGPSTDGKYGEKDTQITSDGPADKTYKVDFELKPKQVNPGWKIYGTVSDQVSGANIRGAIMTLGEARQTTTDTEGGYVFNNVASGSYMLSAEHDKYEKGSKRIDLVRG